MVKTIISDFDCTLINCTLEAEFIKYLVRTKKLKIYHYLLSPFVIFFNFFPLYVFKTEAWFKTWTLHLHEQEQKKMFEHFFSEYIKNDLINYKVLELIKDFNGNKILLTGCYEPLASFYLEKLNIKSVFDKVIGCRMGMFNFFINHHPYGRDKVKFLYGHSCSIGLGDSFSDNYFLNHCQKVYIVGDNKKLIDYAFKNNWNFEIINS